MKYVLLILIVVSGWSFSQETPPESEFQLDKNLVDKLYQESLTESQKSTVKYSANVAVSPVLSIFSPSILTLTNDYFEVPYAEGMGSLPGISVVATGGVFSFGGLHILGLGSVGYSMKEAVQKAFSKTASSDPERTAKLTLHWLPLSLGTRIEYRFSGFESVRPFFQVKGGAEWLYQVGGLDGIDQGFWVPFVQYGGGLTLFDSSSPDRWFGGLTLGLSKHQSFSSAQIIDGTVFDFGLNILL